MKHYFELFSICFGLVAAWFWALSALVPINKLGGNTPEEINNLVIVLRKQSKLSAWAAGFTTISVSLQSLVFILNYHH